jgi:hypothetical protein
VKLVGSMLAVVLGLSGGAVVAAGPAGAGADPVAVIHGYFTTRNEAWFGAVAGEVRTVTTSVPGGGACAGPGHRHASFRTSAATLITWTAAGRGDSSMADDYEVCLRRASPGGYRVHSAHSVHSVRAVSTAPESADATTTPPAPRGTVHRYDAGAAARYALRWSATAVRQGGPVPRYNPDYPRPDGGTGGGANFVSQALEAGGWNRRDGHDPADPATWTPAVTARRGPSRTWSHAADLYRFAVNGRAHPWGRSTPHSDDIWRLAPGDLMFADWTSDGAIDHALIVVGRDTVLGFTEPTISQHDPHRHNLPLSIAIKVAALEHDTMSFYPVTPHASYTEGGRATKP